ncbi:MAG: nuclear transport factor 2 family protein [Alphaproteobacteria bacterium]
MNKEEIVKELAQAWVSGDTDVFRKYLHADFHFKGPIMETNSLNEMLSSMEECPFESSCQNSELIIQGDKVVNIFDWAVTAPFQANIPCVEVMRFEGDLVKSSLLFFDTALMPAEFKEEMEKQAA